MNTATEPLTHHRNAFSADVRAALGVLDRVAEGQFVDAATVQAALRMTGDTGWRHQVHEPTLGETHWTLLTNTARACAHLSEGA